MRLRLILSFVLIVLATVSIGVLIARQGTATEVRAFMFRGGMSGTEGLVGSLENYYQQNGSWNGVADVFGMVGRGQGRMRGAQGQGTPVSGTGMMNQRLRLADSSGIIVYDSSLANPEGRLTSAEQSSAIALYDGNQMVGYLLPEGGLAFSQNDERILLDRINRAAISAGLIAGGLSLLLALLLAYRLLRPIRALTQAAEHMAGGDLSQRVHASGNDELGILANTFNKMADSLQNAEESRRAMTADIAHELRTPLAVQRANLEALQDGIYPLTAENLNPVLEQNHLLTRLVDDLRTLALADSGQLELERTQVDFPSLVKRVVERFTPEADAHYIRLELSVQSQDARLNKLDGDPIRLEQILGNLLSNALRFTPEYGKITLLLGANKTSANLQVVDSGPGVPVEALPQVFERFYRADKSRSRSAGGTGLGLAIARQLAQAHGGDLSAANHPGAGAEFTLSLPLSNSQEKPPTDLR